MRYRTSCQSGGLHGLCDCFSNFLCLAVLFSVSLLLVLVTCDKLRCYLSIFALKFYCFECRYSFAVCSVEELLVFALLLLGINLLYTALPSSVSKILGFRIRNLMCCVYMLCT